MSPTPDRRNRKSIRLQTWDYTTPGAYFVTVCTYQRQHILCHIESDRAVLNALGIVVRDEWLKSAQIRAEIELDEFVVMPNHIHGIVFISSGPTGHAFRRRGDRPVAPTGPLPKSLGALMAGFKSAATKQVNELRQTPGTPLWQRNYYERVIRSDEELNRIREYIALNPLKWHLDRENADRVGDVRWDADWGWLETGDRPEQVAQVA